MKILFYTVLACSFIFCISCKEKNTDSINTNSAPSTGNIQIDELTKSIEKNQDNAELYFQRASAYQEVEAYDNAIDDMYTAMKLDSVQPKFYVQLADIFMGYYRSKQALTTLRLATEKFPDNLGILLRYAELCITLKQNQQGIQAIQKILERDNQNAQAYFLMGILMQSEGDLPRAKGAFKKVVEIDPEIIDAYLLLGELYEEEDPALAKQYLNNALTVAPDDINSLHSMAFFQQNHDEVDQALENYRKINVLDPNYSPAFLNAGILYLEREEYQKAFEQFNILVKLEPSDHKSYFYRGLVHKQLGNLDLAKADFENALAIKEDYQKAIDQLIELKRDN